MRKLCIRSYFNNECGLLRIKVYTPAPFGIEIGFSIPEIKRVFNIAAGLSARKIQHTLRGVETHLRSRLTPAILPNSNNFNERLKFTKT